MKKKFLFLILCGFLFLNTNVFCDGEHDLKDGQKEEQILEKNVSSDDEVSNDEEALLAVLENVELSDIPQNVDTELTLKEKLSLLFVFLKLKTGMVKDSIVEHFKRNKDLYLWTCGILIGAVITIELVQLLVFLIYCSIYGTF